MFFDSGTVCVLIMDALKTVRTYFNLPLYLLKNYGFTYIAVTAYFVASAVQWFERPLASCWASTSRENGS